MEICWSPYSWEENHSSVPKENIMTIVSEIPKGRHLDIFEKF
jgi:hypothetical protein